MEVWILTEIQVLSYSKEIQYGKIFFCEIWGLGAFLEEKFLKICMYFSVTIT